jgi:UPF0716 family protein affecting phage T7 exclusion
MIAPGFLSDCVAILLLLPPVRAVVRRSLLRRINAGGGLTTVISGGGRGRAGAANGVWDVDGWEDDPTAPPDRPELGP